MFIETDSVYFRYNETVDETELYFKDIDGDIDDDHEGRIQLAVNPSNIKLVVGDSEMDVTYNASFITLDNDEDSIEIALGKSSGSFDRLGSKDEDAESTDVVVGGKPIGTKEDDVFTHYGVYVRDPEDNADNDQVILSIPDSQVFARVSVRGQGMAVEISDTDTDTNGNETVVDETEVVQELGGIVVRDNEVAAHLNKNLVLIGGSCINSETAKYLGGKSCGTEFTAKTGVGINQALIQKFVSLSNSAKIAIVVAGYESADTTRAVSTFVSSDVDYIIGTKNIV